ncbi:MAG: MBL fold metallo-hydrolase [Proteobacteria bacterium]|nr:MBL fold metallo-hydrolase [Pseudomonadota bacterium]
MPVFDLLHDDIYCIDADYMRDQMVSIYMIREGDEVAFIDTGTQYSIGNVLATLDALNIHRSQVRYVIPTHIHLDHAGGASAMMRQFDPEALLNSMDRLLEYQPRWMYLTHFGEIGYPQRYAEDFRLWISDYVGLSERYEPCDAESTQRLETELKEMILSRLADGDRGADHLMPLLENDIRLNAEGIAHWWRTTHNG